MNDDPAFDADPLGQKSEFAAVIVASLPDTGGLKVLTGFESRTERDQVLSRQPIGSAWAGQQPAIEPLNASGMAPRAEPCVAACPARSEHVLSEESPTRRAGFHGSQHLLAPARIRCQTDRLTHSLDKMLLVRAEHNELLGSMLEPLRQAVGNGGSPCRQFKTLLAEHSKPAIAKQRSQQEIAVPVVLRAAAHRGNSAAAEDRASVVRAREASTPDRFGRRKDIKNR